MTKLRLFRLFIMASLLFCAFSAEGSQGWKMHVATFNTWFFPLASWKQTRVQKLGEVLAKSDFDFVLLQEAWLGGDRRHLQYVAQFPYFDYFSSPTTLGSGLVSISKYPFEDIGFDRFRMIGSFWGWARGDFWSGKGVSHENVVIKGKRLTMFNLHTISDLSNGGPAAKDYAFVRMVQFFDLFRNLIEYRNADNFVIGGDFNTEPDSEEMMIFRLLTSLPFTLGSEVDPHFCTYCKPNVFSTVEAGQLDYLFYSPKLETESFGLAFNKPFVPEQGESPINLSDHFGVQATLIERRSPLSVTSALARENALTALLLIQRKISIFLEDAKFPPESPDRWPPLFDAFFWQKNLKASLTQIDEHITAMTTNKRFSKNVDVTPLRRKLDRYFALFD